MATANPSLFGMLGDEEAMQRQLDEQRAKAFAEQTREQRLAQMGYEAGSQLGRGIAGAFGVDAIDPEVRQKVMRSRIASQIDFNDPRSVEEGIRSLAQSGFVDDARTLSAALDESKKQRAEAEAKTAEKLTPDQRNARELATLKLKLDSLKGMDQTDPAVQQATANVKAQYDALSNLTAKADTKTEFERILGSLGLSPEQEKAYKQQWVAAKLNPDPSGMKSLQAALVSLQVQQAQDKLDTARETKEAEKKTAINKLSDAESALDTSLSTAAKALKLAPENFKEATGQALLDTIPWTDAKSLKNLVSTLQSEKVTGTLEQLKSQSRTGATGFGALSEKELTLLINKIASLDPTDKMFKQNLVTVMDEWKRVQRKVKDSRQELMGIGGINQNYEDLISRTIDYNKGKGTMSRTQALELLKASGKIPSNY